VILKASYGFNAVGIRDKKINKGNTKSDCLRCGELEKTWEHIIQYNANRELRAEFVYKLEERLLRCDS